MTPPQLSPAKMPAWGERDGGREEVMDQAVSVGEAEGRHQSSKTAQRTDTAGPMAAPLDEAQTWVEAGR